MNYIWHLLYLVFFLILGLFLRDVWKFFRKGFGDEIPIYLTPGNLNAQYHINSNSLFKEFISFDHNGVPLTRYGNAFHHNPAYVGWYGLCCLNRFYESNDASCLKEVQQQISWLKMNASHNEHNGTTWQYQFDWKEGNSTLKKPWPSGMAQGLIISLLVRTYVLTKEKSLLQLAENATRVYERSIDEGGIQLHEDSSVFYEEYPIKRGMRILDGLIFSLLGIFDLFKATKKEKYLEMFQDGVNAIERNISYWDYQNKWSRYGRHRFLCTPLYNKLNAQLLHVLYGLTGRDIFSAYGTTWSPERSSLTRKLEILFIFSVTRNKKRMYYFFSRLGGNA